MNEIYSSCTRESNFYKLAHIHAQSQQSQWNEIKKKKQTENKFANDKHSHFKSNVWSPVDNKNVIVFLSL